MTKFVENDFDTQAAEIERLNAQVLRFMELYDAARGDVVSLEASLDEAVGEIRSTAAFLEDFERADLDEPISDGGHTAGPLFQQQARRYLRAACDFITKHGGEGG